MRNRMFALAGLVTILGTTSAYGVLAQQGGTTPAPSHGAGAQNRAERHPELQQALRALTRAQNALKEGSHDFSGHRAKALDLTQQAINEIHQAMQSDKN